MSVLDVPHWRASLKRAQTKETIARVISLVVRNNAVTKVGLAPEIPVCPPRVKAIVRSVAKKHGVEIEAMFLRTRTRQACYARFEAMARIRQEIPKASYPMIGRWLGGYDHTSVLHGIRRHWQMNSDGDCLGDIAQ